jgi:hypothetical protein
MSDRTPPSNNLVGDFGSRHNMKQIKPDISNNGLEVKIAVIQNDVDYLKGRVDEISDKLDDKFVTQTEFDPIRKLVYGIVALILTAVVGALLSFVINKGG